MDLRIRDVHTTSIIEQPRLDVLGTAEDYRKSIPFHIDWLNFHGALYACKNWHYTGTMPSGKTTKMGMWEQGKFKGCIIYSRGANPSIGKPFELEQTQICELTRVALREHQMPVSKLISLSIRYLKKLSPKLRLVVSYADTEQGHVGTVYQASNWAYVGEVSSYKIRHGKEVVHPRTMSARARQVNMNVQQYVQQSKLEFERITGLTRHKYVWPMDDEMDQLVKDMTLPYPKKVICV